MAPLEKDKIGTSLAPVDPFADVLGINSRFGGAIRMALEQKRKKELDTQNAQFAQMDQAALAARQGVAGGRASTLLTGTRGLLEDPLTARRTLLGV